MLFITIHSIINFHYHNLLTPCLWYRVIMVYGIILSILDLTSGFLTDKIDNEISKQQCSMMTSAYVIM